jgi:dTMP kinase
MFITFEGLDGSGKSTQIELLKDRLLKFIQEPGHVRGYQPLITRQPGGTAIGQDLRKYLKYHPGVMTDEAELLLFAADKALHVHQMIGPELELGGIVLCDRFIASIYAYQGYMRGLPMEKVISLMDDAVSYKSGRVYPTMEFYIRIPVETSLDRISKREGSAEPKDRFEKREILEKVAEGYDYFYEGQGLYKAIIIDGTASKEEISEKIWTHVLSHLTAADSR